MHHAARHRPLFKHVPALSEANVMTALQDVRPDEFAVVMALGDSITAGCLAKGTPPLNTHGKGRTDVITGIQPNPLQTFLEWRGVSYAAGGDAGALTIPNVRRSSVPRCSVVALICTRSSSRTTVQT